MDNERLIAIGDSLGRVASAFAEAKRQSHPSHGGADTFPHLDQCLAQEAPVLHALGQPALADALAALGSEDDQ